MCIIKKNVRFFNIPANVYRVWSEFTNAKSKNENLYQQFTEYMKYKRYPMYLRKKVILYFDFKYQYEFYNETHINRTISDILKQVSSV